MEPTDFITKYRPQDFDSVVGQDPVISAIRSVLAKRAAHTFLFSGPSGVGKTTLARIVSREVGVKDQDIMEIDAASSTGIDAMRAVVELAQYHPLTGGPLRSIIIDECHALSAAAWKSLLKTLEEPPSHVYWILCTTELHRVPKTIQTRCASFVLKEVMVDDILDYIDAVAELENLTVSPDIRRLVAKESKGSVRQALVNLALCADCTSMKEAAERLRSPDMIEGAIPRLVRGLIEGKWNWEQAMNELKPLLDGDPESVRLSIVAYLGKIVQNTKSERTVVRVLQVLECFSDRIACRPEDLVLSVGKVLFASND